MWCDPNEEAFGDRLIWVLILGRAVFDFVLYKGQGKHKRRWQRAQKFIFDRGFKPEEGLTFEQICHMFKWDPDYLRRLTKSLERKDIKKLEAMKFKDDFDDESLDFIAQLLSWEDSHEAVPFFCPYNYNSSIRRVLKLRTIRRAREEKPEPFVPLVDWSE